MTASPHLGSVQEARALQDSRQRFDRATLTSLPPCLSSRCRLKFVEPFVPVRAEKRPPNVVRRSKSRLGSSYGQSLRRGQSRHFDRVPRTSGLPQLADLLRGIRDVSNVPQPEERGPECQRRSAHATGPAALVASAQK